MKKKTKYIPIGQTVDYDGTMLMVVATPYNNAVCTGCFFSDWEREKIGRSKFSCYIHRMSCTAHTREDRKHVIFKEVAQ